MYSMRPEQTVESHFLMVVDVQSLHSCSFPFLSGLRILDK